MSDRLFMTVPRVMKSAQRGRGVVFFHSSDNPFGNPRGVVKMVEGRSFDHISERFYGLTNKMRAGRFPKFDERIHVVRHEFVPPLSSLTTYQVVDPCSGRNWFMLWIGVDPADRWWVYREWPNQVDSIPGVGVLEPWAEMSSGNRKDGKAGRGQKSLGFGLLRYKMEFARLEGWKDYHVDASDEEIRAWDASGSADNVFMRMLDARFANVKGFEEGGMDNLYDKFSDIGMDFYESVSDSRESIANGCDLINDLLYVDEQKPIGVGNEPRLLISERCRNLIFAMKIWTGEDGQKGATKDPVDCLRMAALKRIDYIPPEWTGGYDPHGSF